MPLVVSEVNPEDAIRPPKGIIANPNCTTMAAMPASPSLHRAAGLVRLQIAYLPSPVSRSGGAGVAELDGQAKAVVDRASELTFDGHSVDFPEPIAYVKPIAYNVLPLAGSIAPGRHRRDRGRASCATSRGRSGHPDLLVSGTCVRAPVFTGHSMAVHAEFADDLSPEQATELTRERPGRSAGRMCRLHAAGQDPSLVGTYSGRPGCTPRKGLYHVHLTTTCARVPH